MNVFFQGYRGANKKYKNICVLNEKDEIIGRYPNLLTLNQNIHLGFHLSLKLIKSGELYEYITPRNLK